MARTIILKLGGSIITKKRSGVPTIEYARTKAIARVLRNFRRTHPDTRLILLHGGGSFGHPLAHRYRLAGKKLSAASWREAALTTNAMRKLTTAIAEIFLAVRVPVVPLHTASIAYTTHGRLIFARPNPIETILATGGIPLLGGDIVVADGTQASVLSADTLAVSLARRTAPSRILFATDVPGVYETFPPKHGATPIPVLTRQLLHALIFRKNPHISKRDVTGGMLGKLSALKTLRQCDIRIFDGRNPKNIALALHGNAPGTEVRFLS